MVPQILAIVFLSLFCLCSIAELVFCFLEKEFWRKLIKPFCLLFLALSFAFARPDLYWVSIGLFLGMVGDLLLIFKHKVWTFVSGTFAFLLNHICFIVAYVLLLPSRPSYLWIALGALVLLVFSTGFFALRHVIKTPGLRAGGVLYFSVILSDLLFAAFALALTKNVALVCNVIGMVFFAGSDVYLTKTLFVRDNKRRDFYIMLTYLIAQGLVALGFFLC